MNDPIIHTLDLNFRGRSGTLGAYLIPHSNGGILIETGPGSTINKLIAQLDSLGYEIKDITDVFLTHIHLDHAGAAGWWANKGAHIYVHENGAPHLINPEKLLASAHRLYGDMMDALWGEFLPVQADHVSIMHDQEVLRIGNLNILAIDAPGHANHHLVYLIGDACFSGDIGGIRLSPRQYISLPMPPPDFNLEKWRSSLQQIQRANPKRIIPTHFGIYSDVVWHLQAALEELDELEAWMQAVLPLNPPLEELRQHYITFEQMRADKNGVDTAIAEGQQIANPLFMSADGILRYWNKYRQSA
jgi:glyoxylase-like metal-dependent hydrolase (beta-lactamase superfamily II)